jgi:hypothetical protein
MINNLSFLLVSACLLFVLFALVGAILSHFFHGREVTDARGQQLQRLTRAVITFIITALLTLLIFWTNLRLSGAVNWLGAGPGANHSPTARPMLDIDS